MKKIFNVYNIALILVVALVGVLTFKTTEVKAAGTVSWPDGSTATISRTVENVYNAPVVDFTYSVSTEDSSIVALKTATFGDGMYTVNPKIKNMANNVSWYDYVSSEEAVSAFKRSEILPNGFVPAEENTISDEDSDYPIYIFFDDTDGTIYYYSEAKVVYLNSDPSYMFAGCSGLADISGLSGVNTSKATNMEAMFNGCAKLTNISALSNWDTSKVTQTTSMFGECTSLADINGASNWDTSRMENIQGMFYGCPKASGTIQILGNPYYDSIFAETATAAGAQITVNYGANTPIDSIIAEKSSGSHIVKGQQVSAPSGGNSQSGGSSSSSSETVFDTKTISFDGTETVSNSYTVNKSTTINFANMGLSFKKPGNYELTVKESATSNSAYPVDNDNEYTVIVQVTNVTDQNGTPTGNFNAKFVIKDDNDTKVSNMPFNEPKDETKFGHIELTKTVKGIMADRTKDFSFSVQVDDAATNACANYSLGEKYLIKGTGVPEDGSEVTKCKSGTKDSITLNHGETATIGQFTYNNNTYDSISIDDYYKIIESAESDYTTTFKINSGSTASGRDTGSNAITHSGNIVTFYNQREGSPVTGIILTILPYLILVGIGVGGVLLFQNRENILKEKKN